MKKYKNFYLKIFIFFFVVKFLIYLNRHVFVMWAFYMTQVNLFFLSFSASGSNEETVKEKTER